MTEAIKLIFLREESEQINNFVLVNPIINHLRNNQNYFPLNKSAETATMHLFRYHRV